MRKVIYKAMLAAPFRIGGAGLGVAGFVGSVWPETVKSVIGGSEATIQGVAIAVLAVALIYFVALWLLKPGERVTQSSQPDQQTQGDASPVFTGPIHGDVNFIGRDGAIFVGVPNEAKPQLDPHAVSVPGISIHIVARVHYQAEDRRKYLITLGGEGPNGAALYLTATNQVKFMICDRVGETYSIESVAGRAGIPFSEFVIVSAELGIFANTSVLRLSVDGEAVAERQLPFAVQFDGMDWMDKSTMGADSTGANNGRFDVGGLVVISRHLTANERNELFRYFRGKWKITAK